MYLKQLRTLVVDARYLYVRRNSRRGPAYGQRYPVHHVEVLPMVNAIVLVPCTKLDCNHRMSLKEFHKRTDYLEEDSKVYVREPVARGTDTHLRLAWVLTDQDPQYPVLTY